MFISNSTKTSGALLLALFLSGTHPSTLFDSHRISGRITQSQNGQPVSGAQVIVRDAVTGTQLANAVYSDADGYYDTLDFVGTGIDDDPEAIPSSYSVEVAAPNPIQTADPTVMIAYSSPVEVEHPELELFDALGREVPTDGALAAGTYFYRVRFSNGVVSSANSIVNLVPSRPHFLLQKLGQERRVGKRSGLGGEVELVVQKIGYARGVARIQLSPGGVDVIDMPLEASGGVHLVASDPTVVLQQTVPRSGAVLTVKDPGGPIDGMTLELPDGTYGESREVRVSFSSIVEEDFGNYFNALTPVIHIDTGGGYSDSLMTLTIPVSVPAGDFAMGFMYDETTGRLEGVPVVDLSDQSITVMSRRFSSYSVGAAGKTATNSVGNLIITSVSESLLNGQTIVNTGYKPGVDDWEFVNRGSYLAPGGHCAGQSITSMWYFYEQKLNGQPPLYGRFDTVDKFEYDNPRGYRFASVIQEDIDWGSSLRKTLRKIEDRTFETSFAWNAFLYSMLLTGEPQYVGIHGANGGHAIIAYKVSVSDGKLFVADPNYPTEIRFIEYRNGKLQPYQSKSNANDPNNLIFPKIGYYAKSALIDWDKISARWPEMQEGTIGTVAPNSFPSYQIMRLTPTDWKKMSDSVEVNVDTLTVIATCPRCQAGFGPYSAQDIVFYTKEGTYFDITNRGKFHMRLTAGKTRLGALILGYREPNPGRFTRHIVDFFWQTVHYIAPINIRSTHPAGWPIAHPGIMGFPYTFVATPPGSHLPNLSYVWEFGDSSGETTVERDSSLTHTFTMSGAFKVIASIFGSDDDLIARDTVDVNIKELGTVQIPIDVVIEANQGGSGWAPYSTPVTGSMELAGGSAKLEFVGGNYYSMSVLKDQQSNLSLAINLEPKEPLVQESSDPMGGRDVRTYSAPYLHNESLRIEGNFPNNLTVGPSGISGSFTFSSYSGQSIAVDPIICYDLQTQSYDKDGNLYFDQTESPLECRTIFSSYTTTGIGKRGN